MRIETERLAVRGFALEDEADLHEILGDAQTMRFLESPYDREKTQRFLAEFCIARRGAMAAQRKDSGKVIGYILLREEAPGVLEMGWVFHRAHWGQGYAQEACRAALDAAFAQRGAHKVFAETIDAGRSARLMRRLGMVCEGVRRCARHRGNGRTCTCTESCGRRGARSGPPLAEKPFRRFRGCRKGPPPLKSAARGVYARRNPGPPEGGTGRRTAFRHPARRMSLEEAQLALTNRSRSAIVEHSDFTRKGWRRIHAELQI